MLENVNFLIHGLLSIFNCLYNPAKDEQIMIDKLSILNGLRHAQSEALPGSGELNTRENNGQRVNLRALAVICEFHLKRTYI